MLSFSPESRRAACALAKARALFRRAQDTTIAADCARWRNPTEPDKPTKGMIRKYTFDTCARSIPVHTAKLVARISDANARLVEWHAVEYIR